MARATKSSSVAALKDRHARHCPARIRVSHVVSICTTRSNTSCPSPRSTGTTSFGPNLPSRISLATGFLDLLLNRALQRTRAEHRIETCLWRRARARRRTPPAACPASPAGRAGAGAGSARSTRCSRRVQRVEHHNLVDPVQELRAERAASARPTPLPSITSQRLAHHRSG